MINSTTSAIVIHKRINTLRTVDLHDVMHRIYSEEKKINLQWFTDLTVRIKPEHT